MIYVRRVAATLLFGLLLAAGRAPAQGGATYKNFEGPQVHPLALTPDGTRLLALNTPNNQLLVYHLSGTQTTLLAEIPVGLEPVSVVARSDREAWVVNWLSDSVSVVDLTKMRVMRTFETGDEPTDVIFAGAPERAFVCVSGLSQVKVYDPAAPAAAPNTVAIRGKQPRALARDADGQRVFVSVFESGNETTIVGQPQVSANGGLPAPSPAMLPTLPPAPATGLVVKWNGANWVDERGTVSWNSVLPYRLADVDVVSVNANTLAQQEIRHVGTLVGNAAYDAAQQRLVVANIEALNHVRFEPNLTGRFTRTRLAAINLGAPATVTNIDLNPHINYGGPGSDAERALSLSLPADVKVSANGTVYVASNGTAKVGVVNPQGNVAARIGVGPGPTGLALDEPRQRLYVLNRFEQTLSVVDTTTNLELRRVALGFNPEPADVRAGRRFLYDTSFSAHGDQSCASCHANGHRDGLAWDLGNPQGAVDVVVSGGLTFNFHPMKGPMTTQSFRGILGTEPLHWRGDRTQLAQFNPAFASLLGSPRQLNADEMNNFTAFVRSLTYPPNPLQTLARGYQNPPTGPSAARGEQIFRLNRTDQNVLTCANCHTAPPGVGTNNLIIPAAALQETQDFKVPQLRGMYQKTGLDQAATGEVVTGFGFLHDGSNDTLFNFLRAPVFTMTDAQRRDVEAFVLAFDSGTAPAVGLQVTVTAENKTTPAVTDRLDLLLGQFAAANCDVVVKGFFQNRPRGFVYLGSNAFKSDRQSEANFTRQQLLDGVSAGHELTFTGVVPGTGQRLGIDNDGDAVLDGDEAQANVIDDARFFVQQQYLDFLSRDPDPPGWDYWTGQITACGTDAACLHQRRIGVSAAFFVELEFQQTGSFVYRFYKASLGRLPSYAEFLPDRALVVGGPNLEQNKQAFATNWVQRSGFITKYPLSQTAAQFVDALLASVQQASGVNLTAMRDALIAEYNAQPSQTASRARVMRLVADAAAFQTAEYNKAFVLMQYFGYLRRDIDQGGYDFWLNVVTNVQPGNYQGMVCAFVTAAEYQYRFGATLTRSNADCGP
jgi:DNA-binding beta-propeller fold protein YncE